MSNANNAPPVFLISPYIIINKNAKMIKKNSVLCLIIS
jgi:hypothetical protein